MYDCESGVIVCRRWGRQGHRIAARGLQCVPEGQMCPDGDDASHLDIEGAPRVQWCKPLGRQA